MKRLIEGSGEEISEYEPRYKYLFIFIALASLLIFSRLWYLQILQGKEMRRFSDKNLLKESKIQAPRGLIKDREGRVMVENRKIYTVTITPQYSTKLNQTAEALSHVLAMPTDEIINIVKRGHRRNGPFRPVRVKEKISTNEIYLVKRLRREHPGLNIEDVIIRYYPQGDVGAQLFGYVSEISRSQIIRYNKKFEGDRDYSSGDIVGKRGLELSMENLLRGKEGTEYIEVDARGRRLYSSKNSSFLNLDYNPPVPGKSIELTIDLDIEKAAQASMYRTDKYGDRIGSLIAMKTNGEILAWVSSPTYNPNKFSTGISNKLWRSLINDPFHPLNNKIVQNPYQPGSTFKPFVALAGLQEKLITPYQKVHSPGTMKYGRRIYHDSHREGHGNINVMEAIERSSNVFFYKLGISLGIDKIAGYSDLFGLGRITGIEVPKEKSGLIPTKAWKKEARGESWQPGENLLSAIGQSYVETTAIQLAKAYSVIASEGKVYQPFLVKRVVDPKNNEIKEFEPKLLDDISLESDKRDYHIDKKYFEYVKLGLTNVLHGENGTAVWHKIPGIKMAGKTGTSQVRNFKSANLFISCINRPLKDRHNGWFVGYAPADDPKIVIASFAQHGCSGGGGAAPMFKDVALAFFNKYHPELLEKKENSK